MATSVTLVFPPLWYYATVPIALTWPGGGLVAAGIKTTLVDLNAQSLRSLYGQNGVWADLQREATYKNPNEWDAVLKKMDKEYEELNEQFGVLAHFRRLTFPQLNQADVEQCVQVGTDPQQNPLWSTLMKQVKTWLVNPPTHLAIAVIYPEQRLHAVALAYTLKTSGFTGQISFYGHHHDQLSTSDWLPDLTPDHQIFNYVDAVLIGDPSSAIQQWIDTNQRGCINVPSTPTSQWHKPAFEGLNARDYPFPSPVVDLRASVGCAWSKCTFCAIPRHQSGFRAQSIDQTITALEHTHRSLATPFIRFRDDLFTPRQLVALAEAIQSSAIPIQWSARARFQSEFTESVLRKAADGGCTELWFGLESAVSEVRKKMRKGVETKSVRDILRAAKTVGIRIRLLCMIGYPGETLEQATQTVEFISQNRALIAGVSLSPFQLMRSSPMGLEPEQFGVRILEDPVPPKRRLQHLLPAWWSVDLDGIKDLLEQHSNHEVKLERLEASPGITHAWIGALLNTPQN